MRRLIVLGLWWVAAMCVAGCSALPGTQPTNPPKLSYDFRQGAQGWRAGFADYPPGEEQFYQLEEGIRALPQGIMPPGTGYYIAGSNHSDDLFMFLKRKLGTAEGIKPNTTYRLKFKLVLASNAPSGCVGVGGASGEGVILKAGGSDTEPMTAPQDGHYRLNVDKGNQGQGGPAGAVVGHIANSIACDEASQKGMPYATITREHTSEFPIKSNSAGELWLLLGTDSGFEAVTALYYQSIDVELLPQ